MKIQSLSIVVPTKGCVNNCPCCVSKFDIHEGDYPNLVMAEVEPKEFIDAKSGKAVKCKMYDWTYKEDYIKRMQFARDNGCNIMLITASSGEALQNKPFLEKLASWNQRLANPFLWIEFQTTGVMLTDENLKFLKETLGVTTISLSAFDISDQQKNCEIIDMPNKLKFNIKDLCIKIKSYNFNLRLSLNLSSAISDNYKVDALFRRASELLADQFTLRKLYKSTQKVEMNNPKMTQILETIKWIDEHPVHPEWLKEANVWIKTHGKELEPLDFGPMRYSVNGVSTVLDENCMVQNGQQNSVLRYLILRENCKLYSRWDDPGSLVF